ncbi:nucleotidyltransferase domain-containing protein [Candidatus Pacearchaeota archaeon]|nr:nucleotidyltransferase domain-containing protein [Candidatus Pacearchaeota archaeon]
MVRKRDLEIVREFKEKLSRKIPVKKVILFGSRVKGEIHKWSDFDIVVVSDKFRGEKSYQRGIGFYSYWKEDYPVDFLCYTPEEFERLRKKITIVREAVKEGIVIE